MYPLLLSYESLLHRAALPYSGILELTGAKPIVRVAMAAIPRFFDAHANAEKKLLSTPLFWARFCRWSLVGFWS